MTSPLRATSGVLGESVEDRLIDWALETSGMDRIGAAAARDMWTFTLAHTLLRRGFTPHQVDRMLGNYQPWDQLPWPETQP